MLCQLGGEITLLAIRAALGVKVISDSHRSLKGTNSRRDCRSPMIHFVLIINRQRKLRLTKWYSPYSQKERTKVIREISELMLRRHHKMCNFFEWGGLKVVYRRYAGLFFCMCIDLDDNELETREVIHQYVRILDRYFGKVCELDLIYDFHKAYFILDELVIAGELQESNRRTVVRRIFAQDSLVDAAKEKTLAQ
ncbi:AP-1 complex subunit sigma-2-like [Eucalyptus grandis]|uniref:AP-1 complex subunit sigma-2-like n=1 Tax=Eucalyptus grandis TaxID=71139 RepID=UPI00192E9C85|nr:AP-1 complex subunit sigma-2-like [Eucalyptus grandis]